MLKWVFGADTGPFRKGLAQMRGEVNAFSGSIKGQIAGALGGAAIAAGISKMIDEFGRIQDLADRFNITAESVQRLGQAAKQSGADMETIAKGLTALTMNIAKAENGSDSLMAAFAALGVNLNDFKKMSPEEKFVALAKGLENADDRGRAMAAVGDLLGKKLGAELVPMLAMGEDGLRELFNSIDPASNQAVKAVADLGEKLDKLKGQAAPAFAIIVQSFQTVGAVVGATVGNMWGQLTAFADAAVDSFGIVGKAIKGAFSGNLDAIGEAMAELENVKMRTAKTVIANAAAAKDTIDEELANIWGKNDDAPSSNSSQVNFEEGQDVVSKREKLTADIAKMEEEARQSGLSLEEKITDAMGRRMEIAGQLESSAATTARLTEEMVKAEERLKALKDGGGDPKEIEDAMAARNVLAEKLSNLETSSLEMKRESLEIDKNLKGLNKERFDLDEKGQKERADKIAEIQKLEAEAVKMDKDRELGAMSDIDRADALKADQKKLYSEADKSYQEAADYQAIADQGGEGSEEARNKALDARKAGAEKLLEAKGLDAGIDSALKSAADARKNAEKELESLKKEGMGTIQAGSLASIGGGGSANLLGPGVGHERKVEDLLATIAANTARGDDGSSAPVAEKIY